MTPDETFKQRMSSCGITDRLLENPTLLRTFFLSQTDPLKADSLNFCGNQLLEVFHITGDDKDVCQAITACEQAAALLSADDPRAGGFLNDIAIGYIKRYETFWELDNLQKAIVIMKKAIAVTAQGDDKFPARLNDLGASFLRRFERTGDLDDISEAIQNQQEAVQLTSGGHPDLPALLNNLGNSFHCRFEQTRELGDLSEAIRMQQEAVQLTQYGHSELPARLLDLGRSFLCRFKSTGNPHEISEAIRNLQQAVQLTRNEHPDFPGRLNNLGISIFCRFEYTGDLNDISEAIRIQQQAVQLTPDGHPHLPSWLNNLGSSFVRRFERTGDLSDISEAIRHQQQSVRLTPDGHPGLPALLKILGTSFVRRFENTGDLDDISEAIRNLQQAIHLTPDGHPDLPGQLNNLGNSFFRRFEHSGDLDDISQAIRNQQQTVQLTPDGHPHLPSWLNNLGSSFVRRFERTGDLNVISEAIQIQQQAVRLTPDGHPQLPGRLNNLGTSFLGSFECTGDLNDLSEGIQNQQEAVRLTPGGHPLLPGRLNNLGNSFLRRFEHTGGLNDISEAIQHQQLTIQLTPDGHPDLPGRLNNLGSSFFCRFAHTEGLNDISEAIRNQQRAVQLTPDGHPDLPTWLNNLGNSLVRRFKLTADLHDIYEAIQNLQQAVQLTPGGHPDLPAWLNNLGNSFFHRFEQSKKREFLSTAVLNFRLSATSTGPPSIRLMAARRWAHLSQQLSPSSPDVLEAHSCIIQLLSLSSGLEKTIRHRHKTLVDSSQLSLAASAAALSLGHLDKALEWLVEGRCIVWNQIHQLRTPVDQLRSHEPALAERLTILSSALESAALRMDSPARAELSMDDKISVQQLATKHIKQAKDWELLLDTIRNTPGFHDFLQPRKCANIMSSLPEEGPVVIINMHGDRCDALALMAGAGKPIHIPLPNFSYWEAERLVNSLASHIQTFGARGPPKAFSDDDTPVEFVTILKVLWSDVVNPILEALTFSVPNSTEKLPRIWWCPTGPLAFLPIHAAGIYVHGKGLPAQHLSEFAVSSYIPNVNVFETSNSVKNNRDASTGLLMVSQRHTNGQSAIPFARDEVEKIKKQLQTHGIPSSTLHDENATVDRLLDSMEHFSCIHLACHASQNPNNPLESSIYLHDGPLKLAEILKKNLRNSDFAYLSACQTGRGNEELTEEVVHLASGMLAAGYRSVVGTMWSISDKHGPELAEFFYKSLLDGATLSSEGPKIEGRRAARALHDATRHFRENVSDFPNSFLLWVPYVHFGI